VQGHPALLCKPQPPRFINNISKASSQCSNMRTGEWKHPSSGSHLSPDYVQSLWIICVSCNAAIIRSKSIGLRCSTFSPCRALWLTQGFKPAQHGQEGRNTGQLPKSRIFTYLDCIRCIAAPIHAGCEPCLVWGSHVAGALTAVQLVHRELQALEVLHYTLKLALVPCCT
jgi:hypothetical protein